MGIKWIGSYCQLHPAIPHWLFDIVKTEGGSIFRCSRCGKVKWLPSTMDTAHTMGELMYRYGDTVGYQKMLDRHPAAKRLIAKIQDIPYLQQVLPNEQFLVAVAAVMTDPEYPYYDEELIKAENLDME